MPRTLSADLPLTIEPGGRRMPDAERARVLDNPGFGQVFTDHMVTVRWIKGQGWCEARLSAYAPLTMDPSAAVLHYAQSIFEGLKAYHQDDGGIATFRPDANARRFGRSAARLAMPIVPEDAFVAAVDALIDVDRDWIPTGAEKSLYIRPFMIATEAFLGVRPSTRYLFLVIASPAGDYFPQGVEPVSVYISEDYVRAAPGGTGEAKAAGNYAASLLAQQQAAEEGCDQVVWIDAVERRYVEEMGGMNLFFVLGAGPDAELITPELTGTLLPGITRDSLITLAKDAGYRVSERRFSVDEWRDTAAEGTLTETFACGTAAVITPVGHVKAKTGDFTIADGGTGPITLRLRQQLLDIQHGRVGDTRGWVHRIA
ncbi:MAG: branched-chain amino acid aminotransferase [Geodermatophilaceae bacterium]|jgi:branched-chain amino acid aminotransferase|nr:branched-chain amino acid aminotransferase [Geodermatophilaceae bacterium]